jgi:hypothetical protein
MMHSRKWWAKEEEMVMNDTNLEVLPARDFKAGHVFKKS